MSNTNTRNRRRPQKKINHKMRGKLVGLFAVVLLALVGLLGRITYINATSGKKYKKQVLTQAQQKYQTEFFRQKEEIFMTVTVISWRQVRKCIL